MSFFCHNDQALLKHSVVSLLQWVLVFFFAFLNHECDLFFRQAKNGGPVQAHPFTTRYIQAVAVNQGAMEVIRKRRRKRRKERAKKEAKKKVKAVNLRRKALLKVRRRMYPVRVKKMLNWQTLKWKLKRILKEIRRSPQWSWNQNKVQRIFIYHMINLISTGTILCNRVHIKCQQVPLKNPATSTFECPTLWDKKVR